HLRSHHSARAQFGGWHGEHGTVVSTGTLLTKADPQHGHQRARAHPHPVPTARSRLLDDEAEQNAGGKCVHEPAFWADDQSRASLAIPGQLGTRTLAEMGSPTQRFTRWLFEKDVEAPG